MENKLELHKMSDEDRFKLAIKLLQDQVVDQRKRLHFWRDLTNQPAQIDTGYVSQHLVSIITKIPGEGMRGKGDDLQDGSEVKSANFLDSLDKKGAVAPRWNFSSNDLTIMENYLKVPAIYLVSLDQNPSGRFRARVWKIDPKMHKIFVQRYHEWMEKLGKPKLNDPKRPGVNFQLFPPRNKSNDNYARHGNGRENGFEPIKVMLEGVNGAQLLFMAEENEQGIITLKSPNL
ncbi:MamI family restriction endonuclease [Candidatus Pacearchaeota archaeon]|nr:MamI family restriction endonuclease [Candidatus Pacearchaeota archaeon]